MALISKTACVSALMMIRQRIARRSRGIEIGQILNEPYHGRMLTQLISSGFTYSICFAGSYNRPPVFLGTSARGSIFSAGIVVLSGQ